MTKPVNHIYFLVCALAALSAAIPEEVLVIIPAKWKPYVVAASVGLMWLKGHWNLIADPPQEGGNNGQQSQTT